MSENKPDLMAELAEVVRLSEAATSGEWYSDECRYGAVIWSQTAPAAVVRAEDEEGRYGAISAPDAALAVLAVNFLRTHHAELEAAVRKAARYDWLRVDRAESAIPRVWSSCENALPIDCLHGDELDAAIDQAMHNSAREGL